MARIATPTVDEMTTADKAFTQALLFILDDEPEVVDLNTVDPGGAMARAYAQEGCMDMDRYSEIRHQTRCATVIALDDYRRPA